MTNFDGWIDVEQDTDSEWVFVNKGEIEETGPYDSTADGAAAASYQLVHKDEPDVYGDANQDQNQARGTIEEAVYGFYARKFCHGAFEVDADNGAHPVTISQYGSAQGFCQAAEACEHNDEDDDDKDAYRGFDIVTVHGVSEDACTGERDDDNNDKNKEEEEEEEEEEEIDDYSDELHEGALQDEVGKHTTSLMDAMERYYTNPVKECWQEYICSVQTETRRELHETKMASLRGYGPEPRPFIDGSTCFNPLFEQMWLPWAVNAEYFHDEDMGLMVSDGATGLMQCMRAAKQYLSSVVPTLPVLEYIVNRTPGKKIAHIGSCSSSYWAVLLQQLGASNVIVTEGTRTVPVDFSQIEQIDEETFFKLDMAAGQALFFLRPSKRSRDTEPCMAERCLFCFPGDTIFFVGERGKHADNFDMAQWVEEHALEGWHVEKEMEIPCWPGSHDVFLCITKAKYAVDVTT